MAVSCSHGHLADAKATKAALEFKKRFKPDTTLHLGDAIDLAALRTGAVWAGPGRTIRESLRFSSRPKLTCNSYPSPSSTRPTVPVGYSSTIAPSMFRASSFCVVGLMAKETGAFVARALRFRNSSRLGIPDIGSGSFSCRVGAAIRKSAPSKTPATRRKIPHFTPRR